MDGAAGSASERADFSLVRVCVEPEGAFGVLLLRGLPTGLWTVERTYPLVESRPRGPQFLKIPAGRYRCARTRFHRGGYESYEVTGVLGHSRLLFHRANTETDLDGCIGIGRRVGLVAGGPAVVESAMGFEDFMRLAGGVSAFDLDVRGPA